VTPEGIDEPIPPRHLAAGAAGLVLRLTGAQERAFPAAYLVGDWKGFGFVADPLNAAVD
jgi:hypothetical protein